MNALFYIRFGGFCKVMQQSMEICYFSKIKITFLQIWSSETWFKNSGNEIN